MKKRNKLQPKVVAIIIQPGQTLTVTANGEGAFDLLKPWAWLGGAGTRLDKKLEERAKEQVGVPFGKTDLAKKQDTARQKAFKVGRYIEKKWKIVPTSKSLVELAELLA